MGKTKVDKEDIKNLVTNNASPTDEESVYSCKYVDDNKLSLSGGTMSGNINLNGNVIEEGGFESFVTLPTTFKGIQITFEDKVYTWNGSVYVCDADTLDGKHSSDFAAADHDHDNDYTTSTDVQTLINTAVASVYKLKGNIANKTALLNLTNVKQGDVYNAQAEFNLSGQRVKLGDNIVCISDATTSEEENWDNLSGNQVNRTIHINGDVHLESATTIPLNFKSGDGIINIEGQVNSGILDIIFSSVNTLSIYGALDPQDLRDVETGVHELIEGNLYYFTPNPICGTDADSDSLFGKLIVLGNLDGTSKTLYYHSYTTNKIHVCSGYDNGSEFIWNTWKRLLTCMDKEDVILGEEGLFEFTIDRTTTEINVDSSFDSKNDTIKIDISALKDIIVADIFFKIIFSTPITGAINIDIINGTSKTISYTQFYQDTASYAGTTNSIEYRIWNRYSDWLYHNRFL